MQAGVKGKISDFKDRYKTDDRDTLYGKVDDMELIKWEGEIENMNLLQKKLTSLEQIIFEYE